MGIEIFGSATNEELQELRKVVTDEEATRKGYTSPKGIFALLGDLDFYLLIEKLVKAPVPEEQLTTPTRWWLILKGLSLAALISLILTAAKFCLLVPGNTLSYHFKFYFYLFVYFLTILGFMSMFLKYIYYPRGVTVKSVKLVITGFGWGLLVYEGVKSLIIIASLPFKEVMLEKTADSSILHEIFKTYYECLAESFTSELFNIIVCIAAVILGYVMIDSKIKERAYILATGKPYNLESDAIV